MRAMADPITRASCKRVSSPKTFSAATSVDATLTNPSVNTREPGRGSGNPAARTKARSLSSDNPELTAASSTDIATPPRTARTMAKPGSMSRYSTSSSGEAPSSVR
jgi:hypothetical protein